MASRGVEGVTAKRTRVAIGRSTAGAGPEFLDAFVRANDSGRDLSGPKGHLPIENKGSQPIMRVRCGARRRRDGLPCEALSTPGKKRCKWHGGRSTGPRTPEGRARSLANLRRGVLSGMAQRD